MDRRSCLISAAAEGAAELARFAEAGVDVFGAVIHDWSAEDVREFSRLITRLADDWMESLEWAPVVEELADGQATEGNLNLPPMLLRCCRGQPPGRARETVRSARATPPHTSQVLGPPACGDRGCRPALVPGRTSARPGSRPA